MKLNKLASSIGTIRHTPIFNHADLAKNTDTVIIPKFDAMADHISKQEVDLLLSFSRKIIIALENKNLKVKDLDLWFTTVQHCFYLEQILPDYDFSNIKKIVMDVTEEKIIPCLRNDDNGVYHIDEAKSHTPVLVHHLQAKLIIQFQKLFMRELKEELMHRHVNDGRKRYATILNEGLKNYRLYMTLQPDKWHKLVDLNDFKQINSVFKAHADLQSELTKF